MRWEYFGTGLALIGIGVTLVVALPPPWWPKMPTALIHIGIIIGGLIAFIGVVLAIFGMWPILPSPKVPALGIGLSAISLAAFSIWFFAGSGASILEEPARLRRLIGYDGKFRLNVDQRDDAFWLMGLNLDVINVSDETISAYVKSLTIDIDETRVLTVPSTERPAIIPQMQHNVTNVTYVDGIGSLIRHDAKKIVLQFEVNYDTVPPTGVRKSFKQITYFVSWANGFNSSPLLGGQTTYELEK